MGLSAALRRRLRRIFGPGMLGVTASKFFAYLWPGACPKACQIIGELNRSPVWSEQFEEGVHAAVSEFGAFFHTEKPLHRRGEPRGSVGDVTDARVTT